MDKEKEKAKEARSLYDEALDRFRKDAADRHAGSKDLELLAEFLHERATPEETKQAAEALQTDAGKKYGGRKLGDVEIPQSWVANIMSNIENFVAAGDFVTKGAPESVGMAWYAVKLTLTAIHTNYDLYTFFGSGLSDISEIMIIVRHYDRLYDERSKPQWKPSHLVEKLFQDVISAYAAVLDFSFAIKRHLTAGALTRIKHGFKDFFGISKAKFEDKLATVATLKKKILEESQGAFQDKTLAQLQGVSAVLVGIEGTVRHIQDFQETQQKLHQDAMARFDTLIKGLDDIKASTKRKSQWDYAVQDFQTFQEALNPLQGFFAVLADTIDGIYPGTCEWILEEPLYLQWAESASTAMLCVTGPEGSGKSFVLAAIADRITLAAESDPALLYVTCGSTAGGVGVNNAQSYTADSICRTFLAQLYDLAVQGEDSVGLLETCNNVFKKAKAKNDVLPTHMRTDSTGLPEFVDAFSRIASLLKKNVVLILDGLDKTAVDEKNQEELLKKLQGLMTAVSDRTGIYVHILVACATATKFFNELDLPPDSYIEVQYGNRQDIELVLTDALKGIPGLSSAEQEAAKEAILEKARGRFLYIGDAAIPFMREPFQRPLSRRLEDLPDDTSDTYSKALSKMSPNYLDLLRTALTWTLPCPEFPGFPYAREVMDAFQGTYDLPPQDDADGEDDIEAEFPPISRLEIEQLRAAADPFLQMFPGPNGHVWLCETDAAAAADFFIRSDEDEDEDEDQDHELFCSKCGASRVSAKPLHIDLKQAHLHMALTCLRHLNHPLFQIRAGLRQAGAKFAQDAESETSGLGTLNQHDDEDDTDADAVAGTSHIGGGDEEDDGSGEDEPERTLIEEALDGYHTEDSVDDEELLESQLPNRGNDDEGPTDGDDNDKSPRVRYEIQYWPWHFRHAEELWSEEERAASGDWHALMGELDKLAFDTPEVFAAWQREYPDKQNDTNYFSLNEEPHKPLHVAAYLGLPGWVSHLLARGGEPDELSEGHTPLQAASGAKGSFEAMEVLLKAGADVNGEHGAGGSAFQLWCLRGEVTAERMRVFLDHGADTRAFNIQQHYTALHYFASTGDDPEALEHMLAHGADINAVHPQSAEQFPPLHFLLIRRDVPLPLLEAFIKHGADTNSENAASARPIQIVCTNGQLDVLKVLLQSEVLEIDDPDLDGTTAVNEAAGYGYSDLVRILLEHGADPDVPDKLHRTALHSAARGGYADTVRVLLEYTKQANALDKHGWSSLFCACLSKDQKAATLIVDALVKHNVPLAKINTRSRSGRTVLRQAADHGFDDVVSTLIRLAGDGNNAASLAINAADTKSGMTALHRAARNGHAASVQALLAANPPADPSLLTKTSPPRTALALAYEQWTIATKNQAYEAILAALIAADPAAAAADPDLVAVCAANGSVPLLTQLWRLNAPLNRPDRFGWTPLDLAARFARKEAEAFLKRQAAWAGQLPSKWERRFPGTTPAGAASVVADGEEGAGLRVVHTSGKRVCVSADRPLPAELEGYYFEITLLPVPDLEEKEGAPEYPEMGIGFCTLGGAALEFPGWWTGGGDIPTTAQSWAYHSDTGGVYSSTDDREENIEWVYWEEQRYRVGDTVGCGVDLGKGEIWFTKNGVRLEKVVRKGVEGRLFPVVGLHEGVCFETNFGREGDAAFVWQPAVGKAIDGDEDGTMVKVVVHDGHGKEAVDGENKVEVQVTSEAVEVRAAA